MQGKRGEELDVFNLCAKISLDTSEYESQLKKAKTDAKSAASDLQSGYTKGFEKVAGTLAKVGTAIAGLGTAVGGYAIKVGGDFEAGMSKVQAISGATGEDMEKLSELAKQMGKTTKFSASEAAEGYQYMAMAGWKTKDMLAGLPGIMNLAAASGESLATTSDIVTDVLTAMGKSAGDAGTFANVLASASSNSNTNVAMMGETFKYVAPLAGALGFNIEDLSQAIGLMANSGIKASQAGTSLRSILTRLASPTDEVETAMAKYGITIADSDGKMRSLSEIMQNLRESLGGLSEQEQTAAATAIGGQEAMSGLLAIVNASQEDYDKLAGAIANSTAAAENMANTMQDNLQGKLVILKSALEGVGISIYEKFEEPLKNAIEKVTEAVSNFDVDAAIEKIQRVLGILKAIAPVVVGIVSALATLYAYFKVLKVIAKVKGIIEAVKKAGGVVAALGGPVGLVIAAIVAVIAAITTLYATNKKFRDFVNNMISQIWGKVKGVVDAVQPYLQAAMELAKNALSDAMEFIKNAISDVVENAKPAVEAIGNAFESAWSLIQTVWSGVEPFFSGLFNVIGVLVRTVVGVIGAQFQFAWTFVSTVWSVATSFFSTIWNTIAGIFAVVEAVLSGDFQGAWDAIMGIFATWKDFFMGLWQDVCDVFSGVFDFFTSVGGDIVQGIKDGISAAWEGLTNFVRGLWNGLKKIFTIKKSDIKVEGGADGSHAGGLDYVPYNNYVANLHRGEMVLTAKEAESYRRGAFGGGGFTVQQTIYAAKQSPVELAASTAAAFQRARWALA